MAPRPAARIPCFPAIGRTGPSQRVVEWRRDHGLAPPRPAPPASIGRPPYDASHGSTLPAAPSPPAVPWRRHAGRHDAAQRAAIAVVAAASAAGIALLYAAAVQTTLGQSLEDLVLWGRPLDDPTTVALVSQALGTLNVVVAAVATGGLAGVALVVGRPLLAAGVVVAIVGANLTTQLLKEVVLDRPDLVGSGAYAYGNSYPSGHVTLAASLALAALLVAPRRLRSLVALGGAAYVSVVGISTLTPPAGTAWPTPSVRSSWCSPGRAWSRPSSWRRAARCRATRGTPARAAS